MDDLESAAHCDLLDLKRKLKGELDRRAFEHIGAALGLYIEIKGNAKDRQRASL